MVLQDANRAHDDEGDDDVFQPYEIRFNEESALQTASNVMGNMAINLEVMKGLGTVTIVSEAGNHFSFRPGPDFDEFEEIYRDRIE